MRRFQTILIILIALCFAFSVKASTAFMLKATDRTFAGISRTGIASDANIWVSPAGTATFAKISFGWNDGLMQSGMNDKGLFICWLEIPRTQFTPSADKKNFTEINARGKAQIGEKILSECKNTGEVRTLIESYNINKFESHQLFVADKAGASFVAEWNNDELIIHAQEPNYNLAANYSFENPGRGNYPSESFDAAENLIGTVSDYNLDFAFRVLEAAVERNNTVFSLLADLSTGDIHLVYLENFNKKASINLHETISKGAQTLRVSQIIQGGIPKLSDFTPRDGLMYYMDLNIPYSGKCIDYYKNGEIRTVSIYSNGKENGLRESFYENKIKQSEELYTNGVKNGAFQTWNDQGKIKSKGQYLQNIPEGKWETFFDNGQKQSEKNYSAGKLNGNSKSWFENGKPETEKNYKEGKLEGLCLEYYPNGQKRIEKSYILGQEEGKESAYNEDGTIIYLKEYKGGKPDGTWTTYHTNGSQATLSFYKNGEPDGVWNGFHENGSKDFELPHSNGKKHGDYNAWHDDGSVKCQGKYVNGFREGEWKWTHKNGIVDIVGSYTGGKEEGEWKAWYDNEKPKFSQTYEKGVPQKEWESFYANGNKKFKGKYNPEGEREGKWQYWLENGDMLRVEEYKDGELTGKVFYKDGKPYTPKKGERVEGFYVEGEPR